MKKKKVLIVIAILIVVSLGVYFKSCIYLPIEGTVVDAETKQPIEGAVVIVEWTITPTAWLGLPTTYFYKVIETVSEKNGKFMINGYVLNPVVNKPHLTIYKREYIGWNNQYIFPGYKHRTDFKWESNKVFELEPFSNGLSHNEHESFLHGLANAPYEKQTLMNEAMRWEEEMAFKERNSLRKENIP